MYISEVAPPNIRGRLGFFFQFMITVGILMSYLVDYAVIELGGNWRPMFLAGVVASLVLAIGMIFLSETPRWFGKQERWDEARVVLCRTEPEAADEEISAIRESLEEAARSRPSELLRGGLKWALALGAGLSVLQQFVGIDAVTY
jgi:MFS family permease